VIHSIGIGLDLATELTAQGAKVVAIVRSSSKELDDLNPAEIIKGIGLNTLFWLDLIECYKISPISFHPLGVDVMDDEKCASIGNQVTGGPVDVVSNEFGGICAS
jgi:NAD(P)-dependent dehydrogenase (short-subunit alcohol dehydrogenase family)